MKRTYQNLQATAAYRALLGDLSALPFSFTYNGRDYRGFSKESFALKRKDVMQGGEKETQRLTFAFADVLEITLILTHYFSHGVTEWKKVAPYLLGEFYPLTPWHKEKDNTDFTAYCYFDPEKEEGVLLAFRQEECRREQLSLSLPFANGGEDYTLIDEDSGEKIQTKGSFALRFDRPRTARLLWVSKP